MNKLKKRKKNIDGIKLDPVWENIFDTLSYLRYFGQNLLGIRTDKKNFGERRFQKIFWPTESKLLKTRKLVQLKEWAKSMIVVI